MTDAQAELQDDLAKRFADFLVVPHDDPQPMYDELRAVGPVAKTPNLWFVTGHAEGHAILRNDAKWSRDANNSNEPELLALSPTDESYARRCIALGGLLWSDAPQHTRVRKIVNPVFSPRRIGDYQPLVDATVRRLLDEATTGRSSMNFFENFALPLPVWVMMGVLGIEQNDRFGYDEFVELGSAFVKINEPYATAEDMAAADRRFIEAGEFLLDLAEDRRKNPRPDLMTALVEARDGDAKLTDEELVGLIVMLMTGGHETTANVISTSVYHLLQTDQWKLLTADPSLAKAAREEALRFDAPARNGLPRWAREDIEVAGQSICKGEKVVVCVHAAGHDGRQHEDPHRFDITRQQSPYLSFGAGAHNCIGAALARMELTSALRALSERLPTLRLDGDVEWHHSFVVRGLNKFPVAW